MTPTPAIKLGRYRDALGDGLSCVGLNPLYAKGWYRLGMALAGLKLHEEAAVAFGQGVALEPASKDMSVRR